MFGPDGFGGFGTMFAIAMPLMYACMGVVGGAIGAALYNLVAGWVGGIEVELETCTRNACARTDRLCMSGARVESVDAGAMPADRSTYAKRWPDAVVTWSGVGTATMNVSGRPPASVIFRLTRSCSQCASHHSTGFTGSALQQHREVQVIAAGQSGGAGAAKLLALRHRIADLHADRRQVRVERLHAEAVIEDHAVAVDAEEVGVDARRRRSTRAPAPAAPMARSKPRWTCLSISLSSK